MKGMFIKVEGSVQGVGFRFFTQTIAVKYGISGWVRNTSDGSVEMEAVGNEEQLQAFIHEVKQGPPFSKVTKVNIEELQTLSHYSSFKIAY